MSWAQLDDVEVPLDESKGRGAALPVGSGKERLADLGEPEAMPLAVTAGSFPPHADARRLNPSTVDHGLTAGALDLRGVTGLGPQPLR